MLSFLKDHPFAVEAFFENSIVLTFAFPKEELEHLIPECLKLDIFNDQWAFIAVALVQTKDLRPKGFPKFMGNNFMLIGYRLFVRYTNTAGKTLRGLYILKSETDKRLMGFLGKIFTRYDYATTDIQQTRIDNSLEVRSAGSGLFIRLETGNEVIHLPKKSPFADWKEARRFAGPLPFTFTYNPKTKKVLIIEGVRKNWVPQPIKVIDYGIPFLNSLGLNRAILANAFIIYNTPYYWKKGRTELWSH